MKPVTSEAIEKIVQRLVAEIHPDKIVLFGSRARGDYRPDSDVDILIIRDSDEPKHQRVIKAYRALRGTGIPKDILWVTSDEIAEWQDVASHVVTRGLKEEKVLYEKKLS